MSIELLSIFFFGALFVFIFSGLPLVFALGGVSVGFIYLTWGQPALYLIASQTWGTLNNFILVALPLFIFMAMILERTGVANDLYEMMYHWFGNLRGGLAIGTVVICAIFAAMCGISGAAVVTMGTVALPSMLKRGYDKYLAVGCINSGGGWGILIPPSVMMIVYCLVAEESVGRLFAAGVFPGLTLLLLVSTYIGVRCYVQKDLAPAIPPEERGGWIKKLQVTKAVLLPMLVVVMVLGSIMGGITTITEAAAMGVLGAIVSGVIYRQLSWALFKEASVRTLRLTGMILWIIFASQCFNSAYQGMGAATLITHLVEYLPGGPWGAIIFFQFIIFLLAMVMAPGGIILITVPIFLPIVKAMGFDPIWFGILYMINLEIGYMTPPFGMNLFYLKAIVPSSISMVDIYRSVVPFTFAELTGLALVMIFPEIALWLPNKIF